MKTFTRWTLSLTTLLMLFAVVGRAQELDEKAKQKIELDNMVRTEITQKMGMQLIFDAKVVKGAPYSANAEAETVQILADGNRIRNKAITTVYRDSEGRTRKEMAGQGAAANTQIFISDPVIGANYTLHSQQRVAVKQPGVQIKFASGSFNGKPVASRIGEGDSTAKEEMNIAIAEKKMRMAKEAAEAKETAEVAFVRTQNPSLNASTSLRKGGVQESLGQQMIEGVMCEGKRTTITIAADTIGNDLPIHIVSEEWYSPELQVLVLTKHSDPRSGETIYRLTNISRSEQARALFEVPADYRVEEAYKPMMKRSREEQ